MTDANSTRKSLILHIGHHKTATSFLQKKIFPQAASLVYYYKKGTPLSAQLVGGFEFNPAFWGDQGDAIFRGLNEELDAAGNQGRHGILISSESMGAHRIFADPSLGLPRRDPHLLAIHLEALSEKAYTHGFNTKVVLSFRRQDQYFPSRFASMGRRVGEITQRTFETRLRQILDAEKLYFRDGIWMDYHLSWRLISQAIGKDALLMLPQEQLASDPQIFLQTLGNFIGEPTLAAPARKDQLENQRRVAHNSWRVQRQGLPFIAQKALERVGIDPDKTLGNNTIILTPELKAEILARYRDSNKALANALQLNLAYHGYW